MNKPVLLCFCLLCLTACGQTGPLYLPPQQAPVPPKIVIKTNTAQPTKPVKQL